MSGDTPNPIRGALARSAAERQQQESTRQQAQTYLSYSRRVRNHIADLHAAIQRDAQSKERADAAALDRIADALISCADRLHQECMDDERAMARWDAAACTATDDPGRLAGEMMRLASHRDREALVNLLRLLAAATDELQADTWQAVIVLSNRTLDPAQELAAAAAAGRPERRCPAPGIAYPELSAGARRLLLALHAAVRGDYRKTAGRQSVINAANRQGQKLATTSWRRYWVELTRHRLISSGKGQSAGSCLTPLGVGLARHLLGEQPPE
jgi:hypothetical protein